MSEPRCTCDGDPIECSHEAARGQVEAEREQLIADRDGARAKASYLTEVMAGAALLGADDAIGMVRALADDAGVGDVLGPDQVERVNAGLDKQQTERDRLAEQVKRVRELHSPEPGHVCPACLHWDGACPTIAALDAES